ncbi:uncharacterized protein MELLADRAFT_114320 [Melampsora larici-populina 98AG31]|uniref:Uncharacterized protein n=1 Tax=Melampsora larici-populina (strain 98AG31 / pathotype 3-4-7) TaxID=747676 RepID=F4SD11_MELLP|nr:uncharacterized protein MELLADRAFT_114320 [Melampsora larici-populina 98AG31]EGF97461.1 hypothetical protein MELLADRAFT_114320 [Melampsora larici-populina 98AG31]
MNQDSDDGLNDRQKAKRAKVLEVDNEEAPVYPHPREYFGPANYKKGEARVGKKMSYPCLWCPMIVRVVPDSLGNLKIHRNGYNKGRNRYPCKNRQDAIDSGIILPPTCFELEAAASIDHQAPDKVDTDHDSEGEEMIDGAPDYDEDIETQEDCVERTCENVVENSVGSKYHTSALRKHANRLNGLISKANFVSRRVARSAAWRRHFSRIAKSMNLKLLPLTPGYNATRWNSEFDSLNRLVLARGQQAFSRRPRASQG